MRKSPAKFFNTIPKVDVFDWTRNPCETFHVLEDAVHLFGEYMEERSSLESPQDYVIAWSDSGKYIGRATAFYKKTESGLKPMTKPIPSGEESIWQQLDLGIIPQGVAAIVEAYQAGHISLWVSILVDMLDIKDFPKNLWTRQDTLSFTPTGTLLFKWGSHTQAFKPIQGSATYCGWAGASGRAPKYPRGLNFEPAKSFPSPKPVVSAA